MKISKYCKKSGNLLFLLLMLAISLTACGDEEEPKETEKKKPTELIFTTDFEENELFRIEGVSCYLSELMVYLVNSENSYDDIFGEGIWDVRVGEKTIEQEYKETILARIAQIKVMNLLASSERYNIVLDENEQALVETAAKEYFSSLSKNEIELMQVSEPVIQQLYTEFAISSKLYHAITDDINPEISDDEARAVTVKTILIKTYRLDEDGNKIEFNEIDKQMAYNRICAVMHKIEDGTEFDVVAADYNEDVQSEYSFGRGIMPKPFEEAAFNLDNGQISGIVESEYGYHILQCVSNYDKEETEHNKELIISKKRQETFNSIYSDYVKTLTSNLNGPLWDSVTYRKSDGINTTDFFSVYDKYFDTDY